LRRFGDRRGLGRRLSRCRRSRGSRPRRA
jgi:hypothetical protein